MIAESGSPHLLSVDSPARAEKRGSGWIQGSLRENRHLVRIGLGFCLCHRFVPAASPGQLCHDRTYGDQQQGRLDIFAMRDREAFRWLREEEVEPSGCRHSRQQPGDTLSIRCNSYDDGDEQQDATVLGSVVRKGTNAAATARGSATAAIVTTRSRRPLDRTMSTTAS